MDRHKVLQILINLITNAKYALAGVPEGQRQLVVRLTTEGAMARIQVVDTGTGIAPELHENLFWQGFTTRKDGHGFGLHFSALAAKLLGGHLRVGERRRRQGRHSHAGASAHPAVHRLSVESCWRGAPGYALSAAAWWRRWSSMKVETKK